MFIVWQGYGLLAVVIPVLMSMFVQWMLDTFEGNGYYHAHPIVSAITLLVAAAIVWVFGVKANDRQPSRVLQDVQTGQRVEVKRRHTLFWIPMQWFSAVLAAIAAYQIFK